MNTINILVTGSNSQIANTLRQLYGKNQTSFKFSFKNKSEIDITNQREVLELFKKNKFDYCINTAAFTNVEQSEISHDLAYETNELGVKNLVEGCKLNDTILMHFSTDYVFDGEKQSPYFEDDQPNPINEYGKSKLAGEQVITKRLKKFYIIRTSWLYSKFKNNFVKTILKLGRTKKEINVIDDQFGCPTNVVDLCELIYHIITRNELVFGIYHFSNKGSTTWYEFAKVILGACNFKTKINPISSKDYPSIVKRPKYSVLNIEKIEHKLPFEIPHWKDSLLKELKEIVKNKNNIL